WGPRPEGDGPPRPLLGRRGPPPGSADRPVLRRLGDLASPGERDDRLSGLPFHLARALRALPPGRATDAAGHARLLDSLLLTARPEPDGASGRRRPPPGAALLVALPAARRPGVGGRPRQLRAPSPRLVTHLARRRSSGDHPSDLRGVLVHRRLQG